MTSITAAISHFVSSIIGVVLSIFQSILAVIQTILALAGNLFKGTFNVLQELVEMGVQLLQGALAFVIEHFVVILGVIGVLYYFMNSGRRGRQITLR